MGLVDFARIVRRHAAWLNRPDYCSGIDMPPRVDVSAIVLELCKNCCPCGGDLAVLAGLHAGDPDAANNLSIDNQR